MPETVRIGRLWVYGISGETEALLATAIRMPHWEACYWSAFLSCCLRYEQIEKVVDRSWKPGCHFGPPLKWAFGAALQCLFNTIQAFSIDRFFAELAFSSRRYSTSTMAHANHKTPMDTADRTLRLIAFFCWFPAIALSIPSSVLSLETWPWYNVAATTGSALFTLAVLSKYISKPSTIILGDLVVALVLLTVDITGGVILSTTWHSYNKTIVVSLCSDRLPSRDTEQDDSSELCRWRSGYSCCTSPQFYVDMQ